MMRQASVERLSLIHIWYLSKEQADKADTISPFNFDTTKITKAMSFYAGYIESTKPTSTPAATGSPAPTADPSKPTATACLLYTSRCV